ncbi:MAG: peroxiredoxin [Caulobacterales bacterium 68-7]|nr:MAG: peroxiredoxin [Caulobacterales bacterium 68-7]
MAHHGAVVSWTLKEGDDFAAGAYSRAHSLAFDGGAVVAGSSSPSVVPQWSDAAAVDPEELLIASLSSCHMLWFLDLARRDGWVVESYLDAAEGVMGKIDGKTALAKVILKPKLIFRGEAPSDERIATLHHRAHELCFIANSVKSEVTFELSDEAVA